jgi:PII-like signaling protein
MSNFARHGLSPLYEWIVDTARREGAQGATVLKGFVGLRHDGAVIKENPWALQQEALVIIEVVDGPRHVEKLLACVEPAMKDGIITLERAHVVLYRGQGRLKEKDAAPRYDVVATKAARTAWGVKTMKIAEDGVLLRIFIGESDRDPATGRPLYEAVVYRAREAQLAGATVLKGPLGFGRHSLMHSAKLLEVSTDLPIVIEIVDAEEKVRGFLPVVDELVTEGLVTLEAVRVLKYVAPAGKR